MSRRLTHLLGRSKYEPQWVRLLWLFCLRSMVAEKTQYGLQTAFSNIERLHHSVTSAGNPIAMDLKTRYVVKGINKEQVIDSKVLIFYNESTGKISKVEDKWDGNLPESSFKDVSSLSQLLSPWWWLRWYEAWAFWAWSFVWYTRPWEVRGGAHLLLLLLLPPK